MLELNTRQVYTVDATAIKRARKNEKEQLRGDKAEVPPWDNPVPLEMRQTRAPGERWPMRQEPTKIQKNEATFRKDSSQT